MTFSVLGNTQAYGNLTYILDGDRSRRSSLPYTYEALQDPLHHSLPARWCGAGAAVPCGCSEPSYGFHGGHANQWDTGDHFSVSSHQGSGHRVVWDRVCTACGYRGGCAGDCCAACRQDARSGRREDEAKQVRICTIASVVSCRLVDTGKRARKALKLLSTCSSGSTVDATVAMEQLRCPTLSG